MAQRGRRVLRKADPAPPQTRRVRLDRGTPSRHKPLLAGNQRCPKTLHLDRRPQQDHSRRATRAPNVRFDPLEAFREAASEFREWRKYNGPEPIVELDSQPHSIADIAESASHFDEPMPEDIIDLFTAYRRYWWESDR